jgi:hypothetical protein
LVQVSARETKRLAFFHQQEISLEQFRAPLMAVPLVAHFLEQILALRAFLKTRMLAGTVIFTA